MDQCTIEVNLTLVFFFFNGFFVFFFRAFSFCLFVSLDTPSIEWVLMLLLLHFVYFKENVRMRKKERLKKMDISVDIVYLSFYAICLSFSWFNWKSILIFFFLFPNDLMMSDKGDERIGFSQKNTRVSFPVYLDDLMNLLSCLFSGQNIQMILLLQL